MQTVPRSRPNAGGPNPSLNADMTNFDQSALLVTWWRDEPPKGARSVGPELSISTKCGLGRGQRSGRALLRCRPARIATGHPRMPIPNEMRRAASFTSGPYLAHSAGDIRSDGAETVIAAIGILRASKMAAPTAFASGRF